MDVEDVERLLNEIGSLKENEIKKGEVKCQRDNDNQTNEEKDTRCSIDFRIVHPDDFKTSEKGSVTADVKFKIGGYFEQL